MKMLKMIAASLLMVSLLFAPAMAQKETKKETLKEHKCTATCTKSKHMYAHGEKGHTCSEACKKMMGKKGKG
jgi:hypothetical protein